MALRDFLRRSSNSSTSQDEPHRSLLRDIRHNPSLVHIHEEVETFREVRLIDDKKIGQVDLAALANNGQLYLVEGTVVRTLYRKRIKDAKRDLNRKLRIAFEYFYDRFEIGITLIGAYRLSGSKIINHYRLITN